MRITLNNEKRDNPETEYPDAGATLRRWIAEKVLVQDPLPAMYAYYQEYTFEGHTRLQKGFISLLDLKNSGSGIIPHEHTLAAPKQDRLRLMHSIEANEDFIYMLYSDDRLTVNRIMDESISGRPAEIEVKDEYGAVHRIWAITDPETLSEMTGCDAFAEALHRGRTPPLRDLSQFHERMPGKRVGTGRIGIFR